jgi:protein-arginine kinase activator protein McsA
MNYVELLFKESINVMAGDVWQWPDHWDSERRLQFLNNSLEYAIKNEYWEQAAIIRDILKEFKRDTDGTVSDHTE